jgi:hypothetical protein
MILYGVINKLIRDTVDLALISPGFTIKAKQQNAPRPPGAYADVDLISDTGIGWDQYSIENNIADPDITVNTDQMRRIALSLGFYRQGAIDNARLVQQALVRQSIQDIWRQGKVALIRRSEVREISSTLEDTWEERAQFDIMISVVGTDQDVIRSIQSVDIAGRYQTENLYYNFNLEIPQ